MQTMTSNFIIKEQIDAEPFNVMSLDDMKGSQLMVLLLSFTEWQTIQKFASIPFSLAAAGASLQSPS